MTEGSKEAKEKPTWLASSLDVSKDAKPDGTKTYLQRRLKEWREKRESPPLRRRLQMLWEVVAEFFGGLIGFIAQVVIFIIVGGALLLVGKVLWWLLSAFFSVSDNWWAGP